MLKDTFTKLGFSNNEAEVYAALLLHSPASAAYLAKKTGLARSSVYTSLNVLISKGIVGTTYKNEVKQFVAEDCNSIGDLLNKEKIEIETRLKIFNDEKNKIEKLKSGWLKIPEIMIFEGQDGLKKTYLSMMRELEEDSVMYVMRDEFVWDEEWKFIFEDEWHSRIKDLKTNKNIYTKLLVNNSPKEKKHQALYSSKRGLDIKYVDHGNSFNNFALYVNQQTVAILSFESGNMVGVKITNPNIAANYINIFNSIWEEAV